MSAIPNLSNLSNISRLGSVRRPNNKAYLFDWVNDYIAWDTTIGRTGYDMNISWNVSTSSDSDGSYIYFNGNRLWTAATGTRAQATTTWPTMNQWTSFTLKARFKFSAFAPVANSGIFAGNFDGGLQLGTTAMNYWLRGSSLVINTAAVNINTLYDAYLVYDASVTKFYLYLGTSWGVSTLINVWWTSWPATFSFTDITLGDNAIINSDADSCPKNIYHAAIRNVALTQAEIDADIALWNTTKTDSRIVAYYIPENLQYNTQYMTNPNDLSNAAWVKEWTTSVTANTTVAPDWTTTADTVAINWTSFQWIWQISTAISWAALASKTFIIKAFVKVPAWTALFRLHLWQQWVAWTYSSNFTATTVRQEFTYTSTFWASTSGTWVRGLLSNDTWATNPTLEVWNVRVFLTNESLRDMSTSMLWYVWPLNQKVLSCWFKPTADAANNAIAQMLLNAPYLYIHIRDTNNTIRVRWDDNLSSKESTYVLWNWFRSRCHVIGVYYRTWTAFATKLYINGVLVDWPDTSNFAYSANGTNTTVTQLNVGARSTTYYSWYIRDPRIYTFTWSFTDADALAIYNWLEPSSAWITKYLQWRPTPWEAWTTAIDHSGNSRTWTLTGGVTRPFLSWS